MRNILIATIIVLAGLEIATVYYFLKDRRQQVINDQLVYALDEYGICYELMKASNGEVFSLDECDCAETVNAKLIPIFKNKR